MLIALTTIASKSDFERNSITNLDHLFLCAIFSECRKLPANLRARAICKKSTEMSKKASEKNPALDFETLEEVKFSSAAHMHTIFLVN